MWWWWWDSSEGARNCSYRHQESHWCRMHLNWLHRTNRILRSRESSQNGGSKDFQKKALMWAMFPRHQNVTCEGRELHMAMSAEKEWGRQEKLHEGSVFSVKLLVTESSLSRQMLAFYHQIQSLCLAPRTCSAPDPKEKDGHIFVICSPEMHWTKKHFPPLPQA